MNRLGIGWAAGAKVFWEVSGGWGTNGVSAVSVIYDRLKFLIDVIAYVERN